MDDKFNYDDVCYFQNLQRFIPSEEQKAARRNYLALLMLFGLIQLMGDTPERANIFGLEIGANHMDAFLSVIIIVFLYLLFFIALFYMKTSPNIFRQNLTMSITFMN